MPAVDVAMERSLRRGFLDLFVASLRPALERRDIAGQISDVRTALSSWDNCMAVNYCKWPVIALIIVGGLIIISVAWCIIRCACCGRSCCCSCFSCLKCCGDCCGCCDPPRGSRSKYLDEPYIPPSHGYKSQEPMHAGFAPVAPPAQAAKVPDFAQYATFDAGGKKNEDTLPAMPSWEGAEHKKVLVEEEAVEMNALKKPEAGQAAGVAAVGGATGAASPSGSRSPVNRSPYGPPGSGPGANGFFAASALGNDPYAQGAPAYNQPGMAYSESEQGYGMAGAAMGPGRRSPQVYNNGGFNDRYNNHNGGGYGQAQDYQSPSRQGSYDNYGAAARQQPYDDYDNYNSQPSQGYGIARHQTPHNNGNGNHQAAGYGIARHQTPHEMDSTPYHSDTRRSPGPGQVPYGSDPRRSPAPGQGPYGQPNPARSPAPGQGPYGQPNPRRSPAPSQGPYGNSPYGAARAPPQRQYTNSSNNSMQAPTPLRNDAGFDFTSGYSRPPAGGVPSSPVGGYRQASSPVAELAGGGDGFERQEQLGDGGGYPGYKPYQPA